MTPHRENITVDGPVPIAKVAAGSAAGAATIVLVWLVGFLGVEVPPEVSSAVTLLLTAGTAYLKR